MDYLNTLGLVPRLEDGRLKVAPASRVTAESRQWIQEHKPDLIAELQQAAHKCPPGPLVLLVLDSGQIIQTMTDRPPGAVEQQARKAHGPHLLTVVAVPGAERFLADDELAPALNGHWQPAPAPAHQTSSRAWLTRIANLLGLPRDSLLAGGWLSPEDLKEQAGSDPVQVARLIRSDPRWQDM